MAVTISLTLSDAAATETTDALCDRFDYAHHQLPGETRAQFARRMIVAQVKAFVFDYRRQQALAGVSVVDPDIT